MRLERRHRGPHARVAEVRARLAALGSEAPDALEAALRILMDATGASAGALCLFDPTDEALRLASELGLSDDGCRCLRHVQRHGGEAWREPLTGLLERRVVVVERDAGAEVPPLLEPPGSISAVACLPVYVDERPRASVVLATVAPATLDSALVEALAPALDAVAGIVAAIDRSATVAAPVRRPPAGGRSVDDLLRALRPAGGDTDAGATDDLAGLRAERDDLLAGRETAERAHEAEVAHLTTRLMEVERQWAREHSLRIEQEHRFERWRRQTEAERDEMVSRAVQLIESGETERAEAAAEIEVLRGRLAEAERANLAAGHEVRSARSRCEAASDEAASAREESEQLRRALEDARAAAAEASLRSAQLEARVAALLAREATAEARQAETEGRWRAELAEAERALAGEREQAADAVRRREASETQLAAAIARAERAADERDAALARASARDDALGAALEGERRAEAARATAAVELEAVRTALAEAQRLLLDAEARAGAEAETRLQRAEELRLRLEEARASAGAELAAAQSALAEARTAARAAQREAERLRDEVQQAAGERRAALADIARLARALEETRAQAARPAARVVELEDELARVREAARRHEADEAARQGARSREQASADAARETRLEQLQQETARLAQELADLRAREERSRELLAAVTQDRDGVVARATELMHAAEVARATAAAEAETVRAALASTQAVIFEAEEESRRSRTALERQEAELQALRAEREDVSRELAEAAGRIAELERGGPARVVPLVARAASQPRERRIAVVDGGDGFASAPPRGVRVAVVAPGPDAVDQLADLQPDDVLVNLTVAGALRAASGLRHAKVATRIWGCLAHPDDDRVLSLGRIETTGAELDPDAILALLHIHATGGARVLCLGTKADSLLSVRQLLARAGMSVSIAWDAKQAAELLAVARPDVVLVDLAVPSHGGYGLVASFAALEPPPTTIVAPAEHGDPADGFSAALAARLGLPGAVPRPRVFDRLLAATSDRGLRVIAGGA